MASDDTTSAGFFNYAHSYASSAAGLQTVKVDATHWNAPIYFLYFHAIELYLKAFLIANGVTEKQLKDEYRHKFQSLVESATNYGIDVRNWAGPLELMAENDNVISLRYIQTGTVQRFPFVVYDELCRSLHIQTAPTVSEASGINSLPGLWDNPPNEPVSAKPGQYPRD